MDLQQHKEAWEDFEEWYDTDFYFKQPVSIRGKGLLYSLPFEMQLGVYLKYLDEKEIHSTKDCYWFSDWEDSIEQAFKIRNEQLNK